MTVPYVFILPIIEQVYSFKYLGNLISYEKEVDIDNKLNGYLKITGTINIVSRPQKALKKTRIKQYSTVALPSVLRGSENWTINARDARTITAAEMKHMRRTAGCTWTEYKTKKKKVARELNITSVLDKIGCNI